MLVHACLNCTQFKKKQRNFRKKKFFYPFKFSNFENCEGDSLLTTIVRQIDEHIQHKRSARESTEIGKSSPETQVDREEVKSNSRIMEVEKMRRKQ